MKYFMKNLKNHDLNLVWFYDDDNLESMKKYYGIDDHRDLLKYIRLNGLEHHDHYDKKDDVIKSRQSS